MKTIRLLILALVVAAVGTAVASAAEYSGVARLGWVFLDEEGNQAVNAPTYNLYEGGALSLEKLNYRFDNGVRAFGDLRNITLNNRNLKAGVTKNGLFGVTVTNNQFRRVYTFGGDKYTRRHQTNAQVWFRPLDFVRLYGGFGYHGKSGRTVDLFEPETGDAFNEVDFGHTFYNAGLTLSKERRYAQVDYRGSQFSDNLTDDNDRGTRRLRIAARTPMPRYDFVTLDGGFQHYTYKMSNRGDTLTANTVWGGAQALLRGGFSVRYSFIWDRARNSADLAATDNITHAVYLGKTWMRRGGLTAGYRHKINDDLLTAVDADGYFFSGWFSMIPNLTLKAGYGTENSEVNDGQTLTGDIEYSRFWCSARYALPRDLGYARVKFEDKCREHKDIGAKADFTRFGAELSLDRERYGTLTLSYAYLDGVYTNVEDDFGFHEHVIDGDVQSREYRNLHGGVGLTYMHSYRDLDIESFAVRFNAEYRFLPKTSLEVKYTAFNYDDFDDAMHSVYTEYYTANVVEVNLIREF